MLKLVRKKKKGVGGAGGGKKKSAVEKFIGAIDVQLRLAKGENVAKGKGVAKSWMEDGAAYGVEKVLVPHVAGTKLHGKSGYIVDTSKPNPPTNELKELRAMAAAGKLNNKIYSVMREKKKKAGSRSSE